MASVDGVETINRLPLVSLPKLVVEYPLPSSQQTHEVATVSDSMLVISQQPNSNFIKIALDPYSGSPSMVSKFTIESPFAGLHGLFASVAYPGHVWATLQFQSAVLRLDPLADKFLNAPKVMQRIQLPPTVRGPHVVVENGDNLWTTCKDSGHVVRINYRRPSDFSVYQCNPRPIFVAVHPISGDVYASLDTSSQIVRIVPKTETVIPIDIPTQIGNTPVGLVAGPDSSLWFVLLGDSTGGTGTFGRISKSGDITWFQLTSTAGQRAGLIHLAFDKLSTPNFIRLWLLGSSMVSDNCINAIFTVTLGGQPLRIMSQNTTMLATPYCMAHRILSHTKGLFVTELGVSTLAHVTGAATTNVVPGRRETYNETSNSDVPSETSDVYSQFGLGRFINDFRYSNESVIASDIHAGGAPASLNLISKQLR